MIGSIPGVELVSSDPLAVAELNATEPKSATSNTVEHTGTEADCSNGHPVYSSWYEMYPKFPKN